MVSVPFNFSHPSRSSVRPGEGDSVVVPLDGGLSDRPCPVLDSVVGDGEDGPLLSGDVAVVIFPTLVDPRRP